LPFKGDELSKIIAYMLMLYQDFRGVIIEGIIEIPVPSMAKSGQKGYYHE
jgi:hypothetical protein